MSQIEENINRFMNAQQRAKQLIQMDCNGTINQIARKAANEGKIDLNPNTNTNAYPSQQQQIKEDYDKLPNFYKNKSKLPLEIVQSFQNDPINVNEGIMSEKSVLDKIMPNIPNNPINETNNTDLINSSNSNVDYSLIKTIVEDCIKKQLKPIAKKLITENIGNDIQALKLGNKFTFITKNGDIYEAKLTFIKNIKEKGDN